MRSQAQREHIWVTVEQAADYLGATQKTIRNLIARGELPAFKYGKSAIRIDRNDIDALLTPIPTVRSVAG